MEQDKKYSVKDLIFGARDGYLRNEEGLKLLKTLAYCSDSDICDFYFEMYKDENNDPEIICKLIQKRKVLDKLLKGNRQEEIVTGCKKNSFGEYIIGNGEHAILVRDKQEDYFDTALKNILRSVFTKEIGINNLLFNDKSTVLMRANGILLIKRDGGYSVKLEYSAKDDMINAGCSIGYFITDDDIYTILESLIDGHDMTSYHRSLISDGNVSDLPVQIDDFSDRVNSANMTIVRDNSKIILKRVKKK